MGSGSSRKDLSEHRNYGAYKLWIAVCPVRIARTLKGAMTAAELATKAGLSRKTINNTETGRWFPTLKVMNKIASVLNKDPFKLLKEVEIWHAMRP